MKRSPLRRASEKRTEAARNAGSTFTRAAGLQSFAQKRETPGGAEGNSRPERKRPRDTGPSRKVRAIVLERDQYQCVACGKPAGIPGTWWSIQHRVARGVGGDNSPCNLITLCGSATSPGCHRRAEDRDPEYHARGYWLRSDEDPALTPVMVFTESGCGVTAWPTTDGQWVVEAPAGRAAS